MFTSFAGEDLILTHLTLQCPVVEEEAAGMFQPYGVKRLLTIAEDIGVISGKQMFQSLTNHPVELIQLLYLYSFTVRGVGDHHSLRSWLLCVLLERLYTQLDLVFQSRVLDVTLCNGDRCR